MKTNLAPTEPLEEEHRGGIDQSRLIWKTCIRLEMVVAIGVILGGGVRTPTFLELEDGPPLYKYIKSEILLFRPKLRHWW